jgi:Ca2+-transporting ATPase
LDSLRGENDLLTALAQRIRAREHIEDVRANPRIGSLLILHDATLRPEAVAELVRDIWRDGLDAAPTAPADTAAPWHALESAELLQALTRPGGLSQAEAQARLARDGENRLPEAPVRSWSDLLAAQFSSVPVALLGASAVLSMATGGLADAALTLAVIALNGGIGLSTQSWTDQLVRRLTRQGDPDVEVLRDGAVARTPASRIAVGDWLVLKSGAPVCADARLIQTDGLSVDESALTGESVPADKESDARVAANAPLAGRRTMAHRGGIVVSGTGLAVVTATGPATELGRVRALLERTKGPTPPMERALNRLGVRLTFACLGASAALIVLLRLRGAPWTGVAKSAIALAVSSLDEWFDVLSAYIISFAV